MAKIEVVMPQLGESLTEGTIVKWHKKPGDKVKKDETLLEISTDKVDSEIPSPASGVVTKLLFPEQKTVSVRTVIAEIETDEGAAVVSQSPTPPPAEVPKGIPVPAAAPSIPVQPVKQSPVPVSGRFYSPLVLNIAREEGISMTELENIPGTGEGGRVSKKDILAWVEQRKKGGIPGPATGKVPVEPVSRASVAATPRIESQLKHIDSGDLVKKYPSPQYEILQMSNVLVKMSEHMVRSVQTSPHVQAIHECDMTRIDLLRRKNADVFERREGFKLTFMPFICDAVVKALKQYPLVNASVDGSNVVLHGEINIDIAVALEAGLIVPVVKDAGEKKFVALQRAINDLAERARAKKLKPDEVQESTFSITNPGVFGGLLGLPVINQPNAAILAIGAIQKRPVVVDDAIAIRSMVYLVLSYDHRIVDGAIAHQFMGLVKRRLETWDEEIL